MEVPGRHGSVVSPRTATLEPATVTLTVDMVVTDAQELDEVTNYLQSILVRPLGVTLTRTVTLRAGGTRSASAKAWLVSLTHTDPQGIGLLVTWTAVLTVPDVTFRGTVANSAPLDANKNMTVALPTLAGSSAPVRDAILQLSGPAVAFSWTCPQSGTGISWAGSLLADSYLYVDAATLTAWKTASASAWVLEGTVETANLDYPAAGPLQLWPRVSGGSTVVEVAIAGNGRTTATDLVVRAAPTYL